MRISAYIMDMKLLGLDYGKKRVGYAVGDTHSGMAFARGVFDANDRAFLLASVKDFCVEEHVEKIVLGFPVSEDSDDSISEEVRVFAKDLEHISGIPVVFEDERRSSLSAKQVLRDQGFSSKNQKGKIDSIAAQKILQQWMDGLGDSKF